MKIVILAGCVAFWAGVIAVVSSLTGCAVLSPDGFELSASAGMYRVDQREASSKSSTQAKPMVCWFKNCGATEAQGS